MLTEASLTRVAKVEVVLIVAVGGVVPFLGVCLVVVLHQRSKEDDEDDLQDEADHRQLQAHVGGRVRHVCPPGCETSNRDALVDLVETDGG